MSVKRESTLFNLSLSKLAFQQGMVQSVGDLAARMLLPHSLFGFGGGTIISADICQLCWIVSLALRGFLLVLQSLCLSKTNNSIHNFRPTSLSVKRLCIT